MSSKTLIYIGIFIGSVIGSFVASRLGFGFLSFTGLLISTFGSLLGFIIVYQFIKK